MTTLTDFLLARIAEDEVAANAAHRESMRGHAGPGYVRSIVAWAAQAKEVRGHELIERMTPARVLARCEADRRIVELAAEATALGDELAHERRYGPRRDTPDVGHLILCALALPYADHPDYREEWKP